MDLQEIITSANNILDKTNELKSKLEPANEVLKGVNDVRDHYRAGRDYYDREREGELIKAQKISRRSDFVSNLMVILWVVFIVGTIILCVTGNDIVLKVLHL